MRRAHATIRRNLTAVVSVAAILFASAIAQAQDASEGGEHLLVLSRMCGEEYADTPSLSKCLQSQNEKADRWLNAIVESYARWQAEAMADLAHGGEPFDQVAQLRASEAAFKQYRKEASELVNRSGLVGSINKFQAARTYFELTVDHARLLLQTCISRPRIEGNDIVDLKRKDWCPPAL